MANCMRLEVLGNGLLTGSPSQNIIKPVQRPQQAHCSQSLRVSQYIPSNLELPGTRSPNGAGSISNERSMYRCLDMFSRRPYSPVNGQSKFPRKLQDERSERLIKKNLDDFPRGYPFFAAYLDSDVDTVLFRRFGVLHARALLYKQVELTDLEAQLNVLDKEDEGEEGVGDNWRIRYSTHLDDGYGNEKRKELMEKIVRKLEEYDELLLKDASLRKLQRPSKRIHQHFLNVLLNEHPFEDDDQRFVYHQHDFVTLEEHEESWLDTLMHRFTQHCRRGIFRNIFVTPDDRNKTKNPNIRYYSEERLGVLIKIIIASVSTALLLVPIFIFLAVQCSPYLMALVTLIFSLLFATCVSTMTKARRHEVFAATAAYCAVLVVFIGNLQQRQWSK
ncbi:hypothetical protein PVAG01_06885 [Phlyctema vagabunda]|uniref:DUF6594 domain-containing protein n=1 Tax=Phlyctema vagabunda TaxID=108571 RepID=A0ABR4PHF9_9HELO